MLQLVPLSEPEQRRCDQVLAAWGSEAAVADFHEECLTDPAACWWEFTTDDDRHGWRAWLAQQRDAQQPLFENALSRVQRNDPDATQFDVEEVAMPVTSEKPASTYLCEWRPNFFGAAELHALAQALRSNTHLRRINLASAEAMTSECIRAFLVPALGVATCSVRAVMLNMAYCPVGLRSPVHAELQAILAPRVLAALAANDPQLQDLCVREVWVDRFEEEEAAALAAAIAGNNTVLKHLDLWQCCTLSASGLQPVIEALQRSGIVHVSTWPDRSSSNAGGVPPSTFRSISPDLCTGIHRACTQNLLRRVAANDPDIVAIDAHTQHFTKADLSQLAAGLRHNSAVRKLEFGRRCDRCAVRPVSADQMSKLIEPVIPLCNIEEFSCDMFRAYEPHPSFKSYRDLDARCKRLCAPRMEQRVATDVSLSRWRPYQRLLLAALHTHTQASLSTDLVLAIAAALDKSKQCPFTHSGVRSDAVPAFTWHCRQIGLVALWGGSHCLSTAPASADGYAAAKRQRRD